jgi:hypothetical protein
VLITDAVPPVSAAPRGESRVKISLGQRCTPHAQLNTDMPSVIAALLGTRSMSEMQSLTTQVPAFSAKDRDSASCDLPTL